MAEKNILVAVKQIESLILVVRGQRVMIDADLAQLYGVSTKRLNEQVKRNRDRFPVDFMFQLSEKEKTEVVANCVHLSRLKFSPSRPYAFTEHGAIMAANVLNSERAIEASVYVVRAFVKLREMLASHKELAGKLKELEERLDSHDHDIRALVAAIRQLMTPPAKQKREIGFNPGKN
jgi:phage regulator Rha-like protein